MTRKHLFEAATVILYRASPTIALKQWGLRLIARSGSWKARVALARKLAVTLLKMWKTNTMFENRGLATQTGVKERQAVPGLAKVISRPALLHAPRRALTT